MSLTHHEERVIPRRQAVLLLGGDETGAWNEWYEWAVPAGGEHERAFRAIGAVRLEQVVHVPHVIAQGASGIIRTFSLRPDRFDQAVGPHDSGRFERQTGEQRPLIGGFDAHNQAVDADLELPEQRDVRDPSRIPPVRSHGGERGPPGYADVQAA